MTKATIATEASKPGRSKAKAATVVSKSDSFTKLLVRSKGATVAELTDATGWQSHSVRAFLSGLRKKGIVLVRDARKSGESYYRIATAQPGKAAGLEQASAEPTPVSLTAASATAVEVA